MATLYHLHITTDDRRFLTKLLDGFEHHVPLHDPDQPPPLMVSIGSESTSKRKAPARKGPPIPSPESTLPPPTTVEAPVVPGSGPTGMTFPEVEAMRALLLRYRDRFGGQRFLDLLHAAGVQKLTDLGDRLPAFYAERLAELDGPNG